MQTQPRSGHKKGSLGYVLTRSKIECQVHENLFLSFRKLIQIISQNHGKFPQKSNKNHKNIIQFIKILNFLTDINIYPMMIHLEKSFFVRKSFKKKVDIFSILSWIRSMIRIISRFGSGSRSKWNRSASNTGLDSFSMVFSGIKTTFSPNIYIYMNQGCQPWKVCRNKNSFWKYE